MEALAKRLSQGLDAMGFEDRRELLRLLIDEIVYDDGGSMIIKTILPLGRLHPATREGDGGRGRTLALARRSWNMIACRSPCGELRQVLGQTSPHPQASHVGRGHQSPISVHGEGDGGEVYRPPAYIGLAT